uniref:C-type lectin domain-containing protein n=1 Tax=Seriola lalandi dorsalis TaxID=1841481 RepID=A0A3B4X024_SERLL
WLTAGRDETEETSVCVSEVMTCLSVCLPVCLPVCLSEPVYFSGVSRFRRWLFPALTAVVILVLIIALGASNVKTSNHLSSVEQSVSNLSSVIQSLNASLQHAQVSEALKQLSVVDSLSKSVASLKCSLEHIINNSSAVDKCCPLGWNLFGSSCYFFSTLSLSWNESRDWCERHKAHLVILNTDEEWDFVTRHSVPGLFWVGLSDQRTGKWEWVNQTPYTMEHRRWAPGQPDSWTGHGLDRGDEDCAHLHRSGRLNDLHYTASTPEHTCSNILAPPTHCSPQISAEPLLEC